MVRRTCWPRHAYTYYIILLLSSNSNIDKYHSAIKTPILSYIGIWLIYYMYMFLPSRRSIGSMNPRLLRSQVLDASSWTSLAPEFEGSKAKWCLKKHQRSNLTGKLSWSYSLATRMGKQHFKSFQRFQEVSFFGMACWPSVETKCFFSLPQTSKELATKRMSETAGRVVRISQSSSSPNVKAHYVWIAKNRDYSWAMDLGFLFLLSSICMYDLYIIII